MYVIHRYFKINRFFKCLNIGGGVRGGGLGYCDDLKPSPIHTKILPKNNNNKGVIVIQKKFAKE